MPFRLGTPELIIILVIIILLFGIGRIGKIAGEMGGGIRAFRDSLQGPKKDKETDKETAKDENVDSTEKKD